MRTDDTPAGARHVGGPLRPADVRSSEATTTAVHVPALPARVNNTVGTAATTTSAAAYGDAAAYCWASVCDHSRVASVSVPIGRNSSVAGSSLATAMNTSVAAAPMPGSASGGDAPPYRARPIAATRNVFERRRRLAIDA